MVSVWREGTSLARSRSRRGRAANRRLQRSFDDWSPSPIDWGQPPGGRRPKGEAPLRGPLGGPRRGWGRLRGGWVRSTPPAVRQPTLYSAGSLVGGVDRLRNDALIRASVCVRRSIRREVLHALRRTRRGGGAGRRTWRSKTRC